MWLFTLYIISGILGPQKPSKLTKFMGGGVEFLGRNSGLGDLPIRNSISEVQVKG